MTKEEIKALISSAIAGHGTNVDGGGQLPNILNAIVDAIPEVTPPPTPAEMLDALTLVSSVPMPTDFSDKTNTEAAELFGITETELDKFANGDYIRIAFTGRTLYVVGTLKDGDDIQVQFGYYGTTVGELGNLMTADAGEHWSYEVNEK